MGKKRTGRGALLLSVSLASGIALLIAAQGAMDGFLSHPAFLVREVEVRWPAGAPPHSDRFRLNPPTSIFHVDLKALTVSFQRKFPTAEVEGIRRLLPNRLVATMRRRKILGQVAAAGAYAPVSDDGILVYPASSAPKPGLPVLLLPDLKGPLRVGRRVDSPGFWKASELLATLHRDGGIAGQKVTTVRVEGDGLFVTLESGTELRFSGSRLAVGWQQLGGLLSRRPGLLAQVSYVDLRFGDPVIVDKPKSEKRTARRRS